MFIFNQEKDIAVNSNNVPVMIVKEVEDPETKASIFVVRAVINATQNAENGKGSVLDIYTASNKLDCVRWINSINAKMREVKNGGNK